MKHWPTDTDYSEALQHPKRAFRNPFLQQCTVEMNKLGLPRPRSGGFANVYKLMNGSSVKAVKLFKHPQREREERYKAIDAHLRHHRPKCFVNFMYDPEGIRIGNDWYPIQTMDWVEGLKLSEWVRRVILQRDTRRLTLMADRWIKLVEELRRSQIAHGDLQHDNIMIVNDNPILVDYDGICVPQLEGRDALEHGKPAYQHPRRREQKLSLEMDHFAAWIILIALRALAADLSLWERFVERPRNENILFSEADIREPQQSLLWKELLASCDSDVQHWTRRLLYSLPDKPFDQIPRFELDPLGPLRAACQAKDWELISRLANQIQLGCKLPADLSPLVDEAQRRISCRNLLQDALQGRNIRKVAAAYVPQLLEDWDACAPLVKQARRALEMVQALDELEAALNRPGDGRRLVDLWNQSEAKLAGLAEADSIREAAKLWKSRIDACEKFLSLIRNGSGQRDIAAAWDDLEQLGGHPDAVPYRKWGEEARRLVALLNRLHHISAELSEQHDRQFYREWDESVLGNVPEANPLRARLTAAKQRLELLETLEKAIVRSEDGSGDDNQVVALAAQLPLGYRYNLESRVEEVRKRLHLVEQLHRALNAVPPSDKALAEAWENLQTTNYVLRNPVVVSRCELAVKRRNCLERIRTIDSTLPLDEQDKIWCEVWDDHLLRSCPDADAYRPRYEAAQARIRAWRELEECLARNDLDQVKALATAKILDGYPPFTRRRREIHEYIYRSEQLAQAVSLLKAGSFSNDPSTVDLKFLQDNWALLQPYHEEIAAQLRTWVESKLRLTPCTPAWSIDQTCVIRVRWTWADHKRINFCLLAVDDGRFLDVPAEATQGIQRIDSSNHRMAMACGGLALPPPFGRRKKLFVTIWPVMDLGQLELIGPPLHVGPIRFRASNTV